MAVTNYFQLVISMPTYYDYVLGLIPLLLVGLGGTLAAAGLALEVALAISSPLAVGLMAHAMFVKTPVSRAEPDSPPESARSGATFSASD